MIFDLNVLGGPDEYLLVCLLLYDSLHVCGYSREGVLPIVPVPPWKLCLVGDPGDEKSAVASGQRLQIGA